MNNTELESFFPHKPLKETMKCGMFTNDKGEVLIIHDQQLISEIQWIEYDPKEQNLSLILENGCIQNMSIELDEKTCSNLSNGIDVKIAYINDRKIQDVLTVSIVVQDY